VIARRTNRICLAGYQHSDWSTATHCNTLQNTTHCNTSRTSSFKLDFLCGTHICKCSRVLQFVAVCCSVLQCVAIFLQFSGGLSSLSFPHPHLYRLIYVAVCCSALQCVAVCCSVLQCVAVCCSVLQCDAVCCNVMQRVDSSQPIFFVAPTFLYIYVCCSA